MDFIKHLILSIIFFIISVFTTIGIFTNINLGIILLILLDIIFITLTIYCTLITLTFKLGKHIDATIVDKESVDYNKGKNTLATYYKYTYEVTINNSNKLGQFRLYEDNINIVNAISIGDTINVYKFLNIIKSSNKDIILQIQNKLNKDTK